VGATGIEEEEEEEEEDYSTDQLIPRVKGTRRFIFHIHKTPPSTLNYNLLL
jgi:hypothetical protein